MGQRRPGRVQARGGGGNLAGVERGEAAVASSGSGVGRRRLPRRSRARGGGGGLAGVESGEPGAVTAPASRCADHGVRVRCALFLNVGRQRHGGGGRLDGVQDGRGGGGA
jgi:hypothetical protein